jgi:hypothetical protein
LSLLAVPPGPQAAALFAAAALALAFAAVGWAAGALAMARVRRLVRAAGLAERQGLHREAEEGLTGALGVCDTFLVSPAARRKKRPALAARLARFHLARPRLGVVEEEFIAAYLARHPRDEEVAEQWLQRVETQGGLREEHQDLAARLGAAHPRNAAIQLSLTRLYLLLERSDYPALRSYRSVGESGLPLPADLAADLARRLRAAGRTDPWAREIYRRAGLTPPEPGQPDAGRPPPAGDAATLPAPRPPVAPEDDGGFRIGIGPDEAETVAQEEPPSLLTRRHPSPVARAARDRLRQTAAAFARVARALLAAALAGGRRLSGSRAARLSFAGALLAVLAAGVLWVAVATLGDWLRVPAEAPVAETPAAPPAAGPDPYTLQVAAYLKAEYALKLVEELKGRGLDAYWTETAGGGKRWYQVRVSHFPDQQSARDVGRDLKARGVIDDFYVTNYSK